MTRIVLSRDFKELAHQNIEGLGPTMPIFWESLDSADTNSIVTPGYVISGPITSSVMVVAYGITKKSSSRHAGNHQARVNTNITWSLPNRLSWDGVALRIHSTGEIRARRRIHRVATSDRKHTHQQKCDHPPEFLNHGSIEIPEDTNVQTDFPPGQSLEHFL